MFGKGLEKLCGLIDARKKCNNVLYEKGEKKKFVEIFFF
jgi:hypothetical protein